jgi:hypothetical protein
MKALTFLTALMLCGLLAAAGTPAFAAYSPYAAEVVDSSGPFGRSPYDDPASVLGKPSTGFYDSWSKTTSRVKMVEPAYNTDVDGNKLITTLNSGSYITVKFDHRVEDDVNNPFGLDFLVFGNAFYTGSGMVNDKSDMNSYSLTGGIFAEPVTVSVSQDGLDWYTYINGPFGDAAFPTQAYEWDSANSKWTDNEMDFTKPVDPSIAATLEAGGLTVAQAIAMYDGSGGGTGFDLKDSGFDWIQYIKVEGAGGEIDGFSDVAAVPLPGAFWLLGSGFLGLVGIARRNKI